MKRVLRLILVICLISSISAVVDCGTNPYVTLTYDESNIPTGEISLKSCTGNADSISLTGSGLSYISLGSDSSVLTGTKTIKVLIEDNIPKNDYLLSVNFFHNSSLILSFPLLVKINPIPSSIGCMIDVFPTLLTNIKVKQGETKTRNIQLSLPNCYPSSVSINGVALATDERPIQLGELSLGQIQPGDSIIIPIELDATDVSYGQYSDTLQFLIYNSSGGKINVPSVSISVYVSQGINPIINSTFSTPPSCSISSNIMNINNTYSLTCSNIVQNLEVSPQYNEFFEGLSTNLASGIYTYNFKPVKMGNTNFIALFIYQNSPIFPPFIQEVKIQSSGSIAPGTNLRLLFTPTLDKLSNEEPTIIQIVDNKTGSLVNSPEIYINAIKLSPLNTSEKSFPYSFSVGENYEVRGKAPGYDDLIQIVNITSKPITISISPDQTTYFVGDMVNITNNANASIIVEGIIITGSSYTFTKSGNITMVADKEGYTKVEKIVNVQPKTMFYPSSCTLEPEKWKKGKKVTCGLSEETSWKVYSNGIELASGSGKELSFKIEEEGMLEIKSGEIGLWQQTIEKGGILKWIEDNYLWCAGFLVFIVIVYFVFIRSKEETKSGVMFSPQPSN